MWGIFQTPVHSFDQPYKSIISLLNYVKVILTAEWKACKSTY